ncbi:MAG TPA: hypothetical protein PKD72_08250, partial [Gemmatales bacterium]|nr:hypothetical protein [Gemmatales bacterium]
GEVESLRPQAGSMDPPVVVQVSVPGAIVTPPHVIIPVSGGEAQFVVQPIMTGRLTGARVEFLSQGRKVSEVPLPMKVNRGYLAKFFLLLGLLLPFLINFLPEPVHVSKLPVRKNAGNGGGGGPRQQGIVNVLSSLILLPQEEKKQEGSKPAEEKKQAEEKVKEKEPAENKTANDKEKTDADKEKKEQETPPAESKTEDTPRAPKKALDLSAGSGPGRASGAGAMFGLTVRPNAANAESSGGSVAGVTYTGEDAIWAWTRTKLEAVGYKTEIIPPVGNPNLPAMLDVEKKYEIVKESSAEWSSSRLFAIAAHYLESTVRLLYRLFIVFPKNWPFGDLIYSLACLALAAILWIYTGPNRRKVKGATMDIRFAAA